MSDNNYNSFIRNLQNLPLGNGMSFCRARQREIEEANNKRQIMLQEINKYEDKHPTKLLPPDYVKDIYSSNIFINELKDIHSKYFNSNSIVKIVIDKCDDLEGIKQIIDNYLGFMVELNFESIINSLKKINIIEKQVTHSHHSTEILKKKISEFRKKILILSSKFLLYKQKYKNIQKLLEIGKLYLLKWFNDIERSNILLENKIFNEATKIFNENIIELRKLGPSLKRLLIFQNISKISNEKLITLQKLCDNLFTNIFLIQNENYKELFLYNINLCNTDEFLNKSLFTFKSTVFKVIKETFCSFLEDKIVKYNLLKVINKDDVKKIDDFQKYFFKLEENMFISALHQTLENCIKICENFLFYFLQHKQMKLSTTDEESKNEKYFNVLEKNRIRFWEIIEKKITKLYKKLIDIIRSMNHKNLLNFVLFNSLFIDYAYSIFEVNSSKLLTNQIKICVNENIKQHNIQLIKNVFTLLENDNWKRVPLSDSKLFEEEKVKDLVHFPFRLLITVFNPKSSLINDSNSKKYFYQLFNSWGSNSLKQLLTELSVKDNKIMIFSKHLDFTSLILSTSSVNLTISMKPFIVYLNCFDSIIYDTFLQIFNTLDYYILSGILMIIQKPFLQMLLQDINIEDLKKKTNNQSSKIEAYIESIGTYQSVRKFILKAKKNLECLFETEIDIFAQNSPIFPKLNTQIFVNEQNSYSLMIENIIMMESFHSIFKVIKRFSIHLGKIESEVKRKIIKDEISNYKRLLKDLSAFLFKPICYNIFKIEPILNKIIKFKWDLKENDSANQLHEANSFIDSIYLEILEKYEKLDFLSSGSITENSKKKFLLVMISYFKDKLMDSLSKIKSCSSTGRSIMLKDVKFFKTKLEEKFKIDIGSIVRELEMYVNSWYSDEEQFLQYILEQELNYRYSHSIVNTGSEFSKMDKQAKKNLILSIEDTYVCLAENLLKKIN